ncbi:hypothetical protein [Haladaptatus salinisoli]|uniref:hypothetical protein n=1 Tax=Haladaptatus salinisoli TaxID=2884876 RepID=UPI001D0A9FC9|nr:hypothetical protein [Haladaptatus salinisoli]
MSRAQSVPLWMAAPEEFRSTLKMVLSTAYKNDRRFDRSWTFRYPDEDVPDLMVEITHLEKGGTEELLNPPRPTKPPEKAVVDDFRDVLGDLLLKGYRRGIEFDRSWTFRYPDADHPDLMVEVTQLEKRGD